MKSEEKHIQVAKTARYFQSGQLSASTKRAWIVLHGYGQLASYFSKHFEDLVDSDTCVIAPEGLSRFYLDGKWDRVGATWMTKEDRLHEIEDYLAYLDALCDQLFGHLENQPEIVLLGFSQGTATAWRWLLKGKYTIAHLILWAGGIGLENEQLVAEKLRNCSLHLVLGNADEFVNAENAEKQKAVLARFKPDFSFWEFEGKHVMHLPTLHKIALQIHQKKSLDL